MVTIPPREGEEEEEVREEAKGEEGSSAPYQRLIKGRAGGGGRLQGAK